MRLAAMQAFLTPGYLALCGAGVGFAGRCSISHHAITKRKTAEISLAAAGCADKHSTRLLQALHTKKQERGSPF
jgi:hypothetical protein